jgi:hypothetical protein
MQENTFIYTLSPKLDAFATLAEDPGIITTIVDHVGGDTTSRADVIQESRSAQLMPLRGALAYGDRIVV